jgi:hypothetical protein
MPNINDFVGKKDTKKGSSWSLPTISMQASTPQRRPGRGDDALPQPEQDAEIASSSPKKVEPKLSQSEAKVEPQRKPKLSQSEAKVEPKTEKLSQSPIAQQAKVEPELRPEHKPKLSQSEAKVEPNNPLSTLVGLQRDALRYVFDSCRFRGSKISGPIVIQNLAISLKSTPAAVRKAIQRLEQKGSLKRAGYKDGRGGWTEYQIPDDIYGALLLDETRAKVEPNLSQTRAKVEPELEPQLRPRGPSSSSVLGLKNLKTTTTGAGVSDNIDPLPGDWDQIDSTPLADLGFSRAHLIQLARDGKLSVEEVQDSIHFFAFDLKRNGKGKEIKGPPVSFFMGILRKGVPYAPPSNFESPEEAVRRLYVESKRRLKERRESQEQEIKELEFSEWRNELTREAINAIVPEVSRGFPKLSESALKAHFDEYVWPDRRSEVPCHTAAEQAEIRQQIEQSLQDGAIL